VSSVAVLASDAPAASGCTFAHVRLTVTAVRMRGANGNSTITLPQPREIDLVSNGTGLLQALALPPLGPGAVPDIRLDVSQATVETTTGQVSPLRVPGGLRITTNDQVQAGRLADLVLQGFDPCASVSSPGNSGQFMLKGDVAAQVRLLPFATDAEQFIGGTIQPMPGGTYAIVQTDNAGTFTVQQFDAYGNALGAPVTVTVNTAQGAHPIITPLTGGGLIGAWLGPVLDPEVPLGNHFPLLVQRYAPSGDLLGGPSQIGVTTPVTSRGEVPPSYPQMAPLATGGAGLVWVLSDAGNLVVMVERLEVSGPDLGPEQVSESPPGGLPNIVALVNGDALVVWGTGALFARVFASGGGLGPEQAIAPNAVSLSGIASLSPLANGGAVVAWESGVAGTGAVFVQRLAADGSPQESPHMVDAATAPESLPSVGGLADGGYVAAWLAQGHVLARRFAADGTPAGSVTQIDINVSPGGPTVVPLAWGGFLIAWSGAVRLFDAQALLAQTT